MTTALELLIPALIGLVTGAAAAAYKSRKDLEVQYDIKLRESASRRTSDSGRSSTDSPTTPPRGR